MSGIETKQTLQGERVVMTHGEWRIEFNNASEAPQISRNGQPYGLHKSFPTGNSRADGLIVPAHVANNRPIDAAPAVILRRLNDTDIGQMIETDSVEKGILLAPAFQHLHRNGKRVGPVFDYFAAPKDTRFLYGFINRIAIYNLSIQLIASLKEVCGHHGIFLPNDAAIYDAAETDPAKLAMWHMPTLPLVNGHNVGSDQVNPNNMYAHKDKGALRGTFTDKEDFSIAYGDATYVYWSSTEHRDGPLAVYSVAFTGGTVDWNLKDVGKLSSRPVRAEIREP